MYAPRPPRPKKTNIVRCRTGCYTCRRRRLKCDETKPECLYCLRLGITCEGYAPRFSFHDSTAATRKRVEKIESRKSTTNTPNESVQSDVERSTAHASEANATPDDHDESEIHQPHETHARLPPIGDLLPQEIWTPPDSPASASIRTEWHMSTTNGTLSPAPPASQISPGSTWSTDTDQADTSCAPLAESLVYSGLARISSHLPAVQRTLSHFPSHEERYIAHFQAYVSTLLSPAFLELKNLVFDFPVLRDAAMALSASNLAHLQASTKMLTNDVGNREVALPDCSHLSHGLKFYEHAVQKLANHSSEDGNSLALTLAATLLLAEFEMESGTPKAFFTHVEGATALVASKHAAIAKNPLGLQLLASWASVHDRSSVSKLPFRSLDVESGGYQTAFVALNIRHLKQKYTSREGEVLNCLAESYRIHQRVILECCMRENEPEDAGETMRRSVAWYSQQFNFPYARENDSRPDRRVVPGDVLIHALANQRSRLDAWHDNLSIDELPIEGFKAQDIEDQIDRSASGDLVVKALVFRTNSAALSYMYYAYSQLLSSGQVLQELSSPSLSANTEQPRAINPWAILILRIAVGMVGSTTWTLEETTYKVGLLRIVLEIALCCPDERLIGYIITLVGRMEDAANHPTSSTDLRKWKKWLFVLLEQAKAGRDVYLLNCRRPPTMEVMALDTDANHEEWVAIHGRSKTGVFFNNFVRIS